MFIFHYLNVREYFPDSSRDIIADLLGAGFHFLLDQRDNNALQKSMDFPSNDKLFSISTTDKRVLKSPHLSGSDKSKCLLFILTNSPLV